MPLMGQRAYGRHRAELGLPGTTHRAVQKAIQGGRIQLTADGQIDSELADKAWADNSSEGHRGRGTDAHLEAPTTPAPSDAPRGTGVGIGGGPLPTTAPAQSGGEGPPRGATGPSLAQASAFEKGWKGRIAKLEYEKRAGALVPVEEVREKWTQIALVVRNKFLGLSSAAKNKIPELTPAGVRAIDDLVREYLEDLDSGNG